VLVEIINYLSNLKFKGEGETTLFGHTACFLEFCTKHNIHCEEGSFRLLTLTFEEHIREWCYTFHVASIHSFEHIAIEFYHAFDGYDYKSVFKKIM